ncbi:MAG TPA: ABC transporter ATP-binding protein, partial [Anaerolineae bacterium]
MHERPAGKPTNTRDTLKRIWKYAQPYTLRITLMLGVIVVISIVDLVPPLLARDLIDHAIPDKNVARLSLLALGM